MFDVNNILFLHVSHIIEIITLLQLTLRVALCPIAFNYIIIMYPAYRWYWNKLECKFVKPSKFRKMLWNNSRLSTVDHHNYYYKDSMCARVTFGQWLELSTCNVCDWEAQFKETVEKKSTLFKNCFSCNSNLWNMKVTVMASFIRRNSNYNYTASKRKERGANPNLIDFSKDVMTVRGQGWFSTAHRFSPKSVIFAPFHAFGMKSNSSCCYGNSAHHHHIT